MWQDVRLGRLAGIRVGANWTVFVILALVAWLLGDSVLRAAVPHQPVAVYWYLACAAAVLFLASLLGHELSHALVARRNAVAVLLAGIPLGDRAELRLRDLRQAVRRNRLAAAPAA